MWAFAPFYSPYLEFFVIVVVLFLALRTAERRVLRSSIAVVLGIGLVGLVSLGLVFLFTRPWDAPGAAIFAFLVPPFAWSLAVGYLMQTLRAVPQHRFLAGGIGAFLATLFGVQLGIALARLLSQIPEIETIFDEGPSGALLFHLLWVAGSPLAAIPGGWGALWASKRRGTGSAS